SPGGVDEGGQDTWSLSPGGQDLCRAGWGYYAYPGIQLRKDLTLHRNLALNPLPNLNLPLNPTLFVSHSKSKSKMKIKIRKRIKRKSRTQNHSLWNESTVRAGKASRSPERYRRMCVLIPYSRNRDSAD